MILLADWDGRFRIVVGELLEVMSAAWLAALVGLDGMETKRKVGVRRDQGHSGIMAVKRDLGSKSSCACCGGMAC